MKLLRVWLLYWCYTPFKVFVLLQIYWCYTDLLWSFSSFSDGINVARDYRGGVGMLISCEGTNIIIGPTPSQNIGHCLIAWANIVEVGVMYDGKSSRHEFGFSQSDVECHNSPDIPLLAPWFIKKLSEYLGITVSYKDV